ncbi:MAG: protein kinase [Planctomycetota bacterium]
MSLHDEDDPRSSDDLAEVLRVAFNAPGPAAPPTSGGTPREIAGYRILSILGVGGMGVVYEAEQRAPRRRVALKVARSALHPAARARFEYETELLGRLHHPAVAEIYESGASEVPDLGSVPFFAMALVENARPITHYVVEEKLELHQRVELFAEALEGVVHGHARGVVHRDLKPSNLLVAADGQVKIIDFGLARAVASDDELASMHTLSGELLGTPQYMSPEQWLADPAAVGEPADIYSMGVVLFELLTGRLPYDLTGKSMLEMESAVRHEPPSRLGLAGVGWRSDLEVIVHKALAKEPGRRYASAAMFLADVRRYLAGQSIAARPASVAYRVHIFARRNRATFVAGIVVAVALVSATAFSARWAWIASQRSEELERQLYRANIRGVANALTDGRVEVARQLLDEVPRPRRGWEWRHYESRLDPSLGSPFPPGIASAYVQFSRDGTRLRLQDLATTDAVVLDRGTGEELLRIDVPVGGDVRDFLLPDGRQMLRLDGRGVIQRWDVDTGAQVPAAVRCPGVAEDWSVHPRLRRYVLVTDEAVQVRDLATDAVVASLWEGVDLYGADYSADGSVLAVGVAQHVHVLDASSHAPMQEPLHLEQPGAVVRLEFDPRAATLAVGCAGGTVRLFERREGRFVRRHVLQLGGASAVTRVAWSADGQYLAAGNLGNVRVWDGRTGEEVAHIQGYRGWISGLTFAPSGELIVCDSESQGKTWPVAGQSPGVLAGHRGFVYPVAVSADGQRILSGGWDGTALRSGCVKWWDAQSGVPVASYGELGSNCLAAAFTADGARIVVQVWSGDTDNSVRVLDSATGRELSRFEEHAGETVDQIVVHPDGRRVLSVERFQRALLWDVVSGEVEASFDVASVKGQGLGAAFSADGRVLALTVRERDVALIDVATGKAYHDWAAHHDPIRAIAFLPGGRRLVTASMDGTLAVWDLRGRRVATLTGHGADVLCVAASPDGSRLASGGRDGNVRLWDTERFEEIATLEGHDDYVYSIAWSPDGSFLVSGSGDRTVRIWDTAPLAVRHATRREREELVRRLEPVVATALAGGDAKAAARQLRNHAALSDREREVALQMVLAHSVSAK